MAQEPQGIEDDNTGLASATKHQSFSDGKEELGFQNRCIVNEQTNEIVAGTCGSLGVFVEDDNSNYGPDKAVIDKGHGKREDISKASSNQLLAKASSGKEQLLGDVKIQQVLIEKTESLDEITSDKKSNDELRNRDILSDPLDTYEQDPRIGGSEHGRFMESEREEVIIRPTEPGARIPGSAEAPKSDEVINESGNLDSGKNRTANMVDSSHTTAPAIEAAQLVAHVRPPTESEPSVTNPAAHMDIFSTKALEATQHSETEQEEVIKPVESDPGKKQASSSLNPANETVPPSATVIKPIGPSPVMAEKATSPEVLIIQALCALLAVLLVLIGISWWKFGKKISTLYTTNAPGSRRGSSTTTTPTFRGGRKGAGLSLSPKRNMTTKMR